MQGAEATARQAQQEAAPWVERLARTGYLAKGIVYVAVGVLAAKAAWGSGGQTTGSSGAVESLAGGTFGTVILWIVGIGLLGYVVWRLVQAFMDPENEGTDGEGLAKRALYFVTGLLYGGLAIEAIRLANGNGGGGGGGGGGADHWTAQLMAVPFGRWLVALAGVGVIAYGIVEFKKAADESYMDQLKRDMRHETERWIRRAGKAGLSARGVTFGVMGFFLLVAAWQAQPEEARGLGGALQTLQEQPWGSWLLGLVALGLVCYGAFQVVKARYRVIRPQ